MSASEVGIEKKIIAVAAVFVLALTGVIAMSVKMFGITVPTCLTDVKPFADGKLMEQAPKRYELHYLARMWKFEPDDVYVEPGSVVDLYLSTADVTHGMQIVGTNVNLMAVPGAVNYARVKFDRAGDYVVVCNEYCGAAHHNMSTVIHVTDKKPVKHPEAELASAAGPQLFEKYGCNACHSIDGSPGVGPTLKGLYHSTRELANGQQVTVEDDYLRESIEKPDAKIAKGFEPMMPKTDITKPDLDALVQYLETIK